MQINFPSRLWSYLPRVPIILTTTVYIYTVGKKSIEHITIFLSKYISKDAVDLKFSPDVGNNPSNVYIQRQNK